MHAHLETLHQLYSSETQSFRKVHRMIDLFESIIKSHTVVVLGEYVKHNKLSDAAKGMLAQGLRTPSLGTWQLFSRVMFEELQADGYAWTFPDFQSEFAALDKSLNADKTNVIAFRNGYAHGATPTDAQCEADIAKFDPFLKKLLDCRWLTTTHLEAREGKVWVVGEGAEVCVHPVLVHKADGGDTPFAFFNDLKNDKVGLLNYPLSKHYREKEFFKEFHEFLPLHEWKKSGNNEFYQRIEELTETFKGRTLERETLLQFVRENHKGYCSIQGNPGIGKSALIAQFFKDLRAQKELTDVQVVEYFIRRGTIQAQTEYVFNYLIRRTDELFAPGKEIRAEGKAVWDLQQQLFAKWRLWGEQRAGKKLLFLIDGLDEGTENNVVTYMPRENFEGVLIIYGSRPGGHKSIEDLWTQLPTERHTKLELAGLGREDIRALIYEVANKYEVERESAWIDAVQQRSQGNPLYLKLLCDALEHGSIALNDIQALPDKIDEYYKAILDRYAADTVDGDALLAGLFTFAAARDYLTMAHLGLINKLGDATVQRIGSTLKEVLYENPLTEDVLDYQLFHESFREYLVKEKAMKVNDAVERIIDFCSTWRDLEGTWEQRYALQHYAAHAAASAREARATELLTLPGNSAYIETQQKVLKQFDATKELYRLCLLKASELKQYDRQLEAALCLVDLKYEEANDAPQVVALVAAGDIDLALKRIESFGGTDKEGVKRRFTLYMLCLLELTLLESKTKPFRKAAIEKLLNHLDEHIPPDTSIINWNEFFPSYLMFLMACEWAELELDYLIVYKRTDDWEKDWLSEKGPYSDLQFEVLLECARAIPDESYKSSVLKDISSELAKQGHLEEAKSSLKEALNCARGINPFLASNALRAIGVELAKQGHAEEALAALQEAFDCARSFSENSRCEALAAISAELAKQGHLEMSATAMREALISAGEISDASSKSYAHMAISGSLSEQGHTKEAADAKHEALACARGLSDETRIHALKNISAELAKRGNSEEAASAIQEALDCVLGHKEDFQRDYLLLSICTEMAEQGLFEEAMAQAEVQLGAFSKDQAFLICSKKLIIKGRLKEAHSCINRLSDESKIKAFISLSNELAKQGRANEAISAIQLSSSYVNGIKQKETRIEALEGIYKALAEQGKTEMASAALLETLTISPGINSYYWQGRALVMLSRGLASRGKDPESLEALQEARKYTLSFFGIDTIISAIEVIVVISNEFVKKGKIDEVLNHLKDELPADLNTFLEIANVQSYSAITAELVKRGRIEEAYSIVRNIRHESDKIKPLAFMSYELAQQGYSEKAHSVMQQAMAYADGISFDYVKSIVQRDLCSELVRQDKIEEALDYARSISDEFCKSSSLETISAEMAKKFRFDEATGVMQEALSCAREISSDSIRSRALSNIGAEQGRQGKIEERILVLEESEAVGVGITDIAVRYECWMETAKAALEKDSWKVALNRMQFYENEEARLFYIKGWSEYVAADDVASECIEAALPFIAGDSESIETLLQKHALYEVFFGNAGREKIDRLNRTLNIQWALDIAAQFPKVESEPRLSTNLDTWLQEIADEDDRDQITLWAKQVAKGKITEEEFGERVRGME